MGTVHVPQRPRPVRLRALPGRPLRAKRRCNRHAKSTRAAQPHLANIAGDLQRQRAVRHIHGVRTEDLGDLGHLGAGGPGGRVHLPRWRGRARQGDTVSTHARDGSSRAGRASHNPPCMRRSAQGPRRAARGSKPDARLDTGRGPHAHFPALPQLQPPPPGCHTAWPVCALPDTPRIARLYEHELALHVWCIGDILDIPGPRGKG